METIEILNRRLVERYGTNLILKARYRIVWSSDQFEKRLSEFSDFHTIHILLRTVKEVREVRKYPDFQNRWVLETLTYCPFPAVKDHNGYEPLFVFQRNDGTPLDPNWNAIEFILNRLNTRVVPKSPSTFVEEEEKEQEAEAQKFMEMLENPTEVAESKRLTNTVTVEISNNVGV